MEKKWMKSSEIAKKPLIGRQQAGEYTGLQSEAG